MPTDTVYGLAGTAETPAGRDAVYALKGRDEGQPSALMVGSVAQLLELVPELEGELAAKIGALLPGPYTLVVPNPARRYPWLCGADPHAIGLRVPDVTGPGAEILAAYPVVATSANLPGDPEPARLDDVPRELLDSAAAAVDGGVLPGVASTVLDLRGAEPLVLRAGAGSVELALARLAVMP